MYFYLKLYFNFDFIITCVTVEVHAHLSAYPLLLYGP